MTLNLQAMKTKLVTFNINVSENVSHEDLQEFLEFEVFQRGGLSNENSLFNSCMDDLNPKNLTVSWH